MGKWRATLKGMNLLTKLLGVLSAGLLAGGLVLGLAVPVHAGGDKCGAAFKSANALISPQCPDAQSDARRTPILLLVLAGTALLATLISSQESAAAHPSSAA